MAVRDACSSHASDSHCLDLACFDIEGGGWPAKKKTIGLKLAESASLMAADSRSLLPDP
jgi:hypothetical protein